MNEEKEIKEEKIEIEKDQDYGFLIAYIPFRTKLLKCDETFYNKNEHKVVEEKINTKLILKTVKNNINENVRFYTLFRNRLSVNDQKETVLQKFEKNPELNPDIRSLEKIIKDHVDSESKRNIGIKMWLNMKPKW